MIASDPKRYYVVCLVDSCTRVAWAEVVEDIKSLTVMFASLRCLNQISSRYDIRFAEILTDNGPEFGPKESAKKDQHPFERLCIEMGIKHRHTRPYRPQTNGKVERFWRTLNEDLIEGTYFESIEHFKQELLDYMIYYNQMRPHQALNGKFPKQFADSCQRIM
jgi:transposase InsO family protein